MPVTVSDVFELRYPQTGLYRADENVAWTVRAQSLLIVTLMSVDISPGDFLQYGLGPTFGVNPLQFFQGVTSTVPVMNMMSDNTAWVLFRSNTDTETGTGFSLLFTTMGEDRLVVLVL